LRIAIEYDFQNSIEIVSVYIVFFKLKVKVPVIFSGTEGFPARRDAR